MLFAMLGINWPSGSGEKDFKIFWIQIYYFAIISPWIRAWPYIWTNLNPLYPRMLFVKFGWNWPSGFGEEDFKKMFNIILHFRYNLPLEKGVKQTWISSTQGCFEPSLVEIGPVVLDKKLKTWKVYRWTDRQTTHNSWSEKLTWAFSPGELIKTNTPPLSENPWHSHLLPRDWQWTSGMTMSRDKKTVTRTQSHVKNPFKFDLEIKDKGHTEFMNVCNTSSNGETPM